MDYEELERRQERIQTGFTFIARDSARIMMSLSGISLVFENLKDHEDGENVSGENLQAAFDYCIEATTRLTDVANWCDYVSSLLPEPFNKLCDTNFNGGVSDQLLEQILLAKTQSDIKFRDQLEDPEPAMMRSIENTWVEREED